MTNYKKKYDKLKVEYDILRRGKGGKKSLKPDELFTTLQSLYIDKLERMNDQQNILSKQASILNDKDRQINRNESILKSNKLKIDTHKRKTVYNEKDDSNTKSANSITTIPTIDSTVTDHRYQTQSITPYGRKLFDSVSTTYKASIAI